MAVSVYPEGSTAQASTEDPEEVKLAVTSSAVEVSTDAVAPEAPAVTPASAALVVSPTPV